MNKQLEDKDAALDYIKNKMFCKLGVSEINQVGVFAYKDIPKGVDPLEPYEEYGFVLITEEEETTIDNEVIEEMQRHHFSPEGLTLAQLDDRSYFSQYLNHSETPNTIFDTTCKSGIRTTAIIKAGDEITANYNETQEILKKSIDDFHNKEKLVEQQVPQTL